MGESPIQQYRDLVFFYIVSEEEMPLVKLFRRDSDYDRTRGRSPG